MSTEIKNTLYRFVTMRAPELVEQNIVVKSFVLHPESLFGLESQTSVFLTNIHSIPEGKTKKQILFEVSASFKEGALKDREEVKARVGNELFDFAVWLTKNRATLDGKEVDKKISTSSLLNQIITTKTSNINLIELWDNLFYQIITFESGYVREAILSVLVADFFLKNYNEIARSQKELRILAQARVIMPMDLFKPSPTTNLTAFKDELRQKYPVLRKETRTALEVVLIEEQIRELKSLTGNLSLIEKKYNKENQVKLKEYNKIFESDVQLAYSTATKIETIEIDPITNVERTVVTYENLNLPTYDFEAVDVLKFLFENLSNDELIKRYLEVYNFDSFEEIKQLMKNDIEKLSNFLFDRILVSQKVIATGGVTLNLNRTSNMQISSNGNLSVLTVTNFSQKILVLDFVALNLNGAAFLGNIKITMKDVNGIEIPLTINFDQSDLVSGTNSIIRKLLPSNQLLEEGDFIFSGVINSSLQATSFSGVLNIEAILPPNNSNPSNGSGNTGGTNPGGGSSGSNPNILTNISHEFNEVFFRTFNSDLDFVINGSGWYAGKEIDTNNDQNSGNSNNTTTNSLDYIPSGYGIKRLGIADYRKVEQEVCCYVPGEVSHIENVMAREYKEKSTRRLRRQEDTITTTKEKETEKLSDTSSTERFEMNQEVSSVLAEQNSFAAGTQISWEGAIKGTAYADFAHNTSQETSNHQAVTNAQEVTERVLERVVQKVKEERVSKIIEEFEENSKHGYDNRKGDKHVSGVYRWVDKIMKNQVVNYGKRLMYEFMIPEPAAFHNQAVAEYGLSNDDEVLEIPQDPRISITIPLKIDSNFDDRYLNWAELYNAEIESMPEKAISICKSFSFSNKENKDGNRMWDENTTIDVPEGYITKKATVKANHIRMVSSWGSHFMIGVGNKNIEYAGNSNPNSLFPSNKECFFDNLDPFTDKIPVSFASLVNYCGAINVTINCELTNAAKKQWQLETYNAIIDAYEAKLAEYNEKLADLKNIQLAKAKSNPMFYRQIENNVLRKNCIDYLISNEKLGQNMIVGTNLKNLRANYDSLDLETYTAKVKFFEQAFEWDLMSYYFYPFYWANKEKWTNLYNVEEVDDAVFRAFLQSGMARVILTVRPGFEEVVNWYMGTGQVWNGGQVPTMNDELFISIVKELQEPTGEVEQTWESRVPTSLTVIQAGTIGLNVEGLPCNEECEDNLKFASDGQPVLDENGDQINIIGQNADSVQLGNITNDLVEVTDSIEEIKTDIEEIKTILEGMNP